MSTSKASEEQIRELAATLADQAQAIADDTIVGPRFAAIKRLQDNVDTLAAWVGDDR